MFRRMEKFGRRSYHKSDNGNKKKQKGTQQKKAYPYTK